MQVSEWMGMEKCPKCTRRTIRSSGLKYVCGACGFKMDKPRCAKCKSYGLRAINYYPDRIEVVFTCLNCNLGGFIFKGFD